MEKASTYRMQRRAGYEAKGLDDTGEVICADSEECTEGMATNKKKVFTEMPVLVKVCSMFNVTISIHS